MDDIFDSLIYIIITIAAFVISALGKKKKKHPNVPPMQGNREPQPEKKKPLIPDIEQLIREEMGLETNEYDETPVENQTEKKEEIVNEKPLDFVPPEMLDDKPDIPYSIEYDNADLSNHNSIKNSDTLEELDEEESELSDFNFREAIIYSEIINRKEY